MIAVTFALPAESRDFVRRIRGHTNEAGVIAGSIGKTALEVLHTGVGCAVAERRLRKYLEHSTPDFVIAAGFAGATIHGCSIGDIILASNRSDPSLLASAEKGLARFKPSKGNLFTAPEMIDSAAERADLWSREQAIAIDMETATIADICRENGRRLLSLRVLSDTPEEPFPLPAHVLFDMQRQRTMARRLIRYLVARPSSMVRLIRFSRQIRRARKSLTTALLIVLEALRAPADEHD
jgi:adenosylhomocysteine nucleosidase